MLVCFSSEFIIPLQNASSAAFPFCNQLGVCSFGWWLMAGADLF
jgi:hypothetical protein